MATARALDEGMVAGTGTAARTRRAVQGAGLALGLLSAMCFGTSGTSGAALITAGWDPGSTS